jgi:hypothetical protein
MDFSGGTTMDRQTFKFILSSRSSYPESNGSGGVVSIETRLQSGRSGVGISLEERDFSFL